jgi:hypothetical protein
MKSLSLKNKSIFIILLISFFFFIFARYNGNYHSDYKHIWLFLNGGMQNDIYENSSILLKTSFVFHILKFFKLNLDNDYVGLIIHYILSIFAAYYLYKILFFIKISNKGNEILFFIICLSSIDSILLNTPKSGWIAQHTLVPSHFALSFLFYYLYQVLKNNKKKLIFSTICFFLISPRAAWQPVLVAFFYLLLPSFKLKNISWFFPTVLLIILYAFYDNSFNQEITKDLFSEVLRREGEENAIHLQSTKYKTICIISFFLYPFLLKKINTKYNYFFNTVYVLGILTFCFGYVYGKYGVYIYPNQKILALSAVRSLYIYQLFFFIVYLFFIQQNFKQKLYKYGLSLFPFLLSFGGKGLILFLIILFFLILDKFIIKSFLKKKILSYELFVITFIVLVIILNSTFNRIKKIDFFTLHKINHWSTQLKGEYELKSFFLNLRNCEDFIIFDNLKNNTDANFFASKSKYLSLNNISLGHNAILLEEHRRRLKLIENLDIISQNKINLLKEENFLYLTKNEIITDNIYYIKKNFGNLYFFFNDSKFKLLKKCKALFN